MLYTHTDSQTYTYTHAIMKNFSANLPIISTVTLISKAISATTVCNDGIVLTTAQCKKKLDNIKTAIKISQLLQCSYWFKTSDFSSVISSPFWDRIGILLTNLCILCLKWVKRGTVLDFQFEKLVKCAGIIHNHQCFSFFK